MAILNNTGATDPRFYCRFCLQNHDVQMEEQASSATWGGNQRTLTITKLCSCELGILTNSTTTNIKAKETPVTQQFDTTTEKSMALSNVMNRVRKVETALFNRAEALAKVQAEHEKHITEAGIALDRVLIEAWQTGVNMEEYDKFLPEYADKLQLRLEELVGIISLANAELPV